MNKSTPNKISAFLVDDEERGISSLSQLIHNYCPTVNIVGSAQNIDLAYTHIMATKPQLVFLDIAMPPHTGFDLLKMFANIPFKVIFVTAFNDFALQAIKFSALDYLLKPVNVDELKTAVEKVKQHHASIFTNQFEVAWQHFKKPLQTNKVVIISKDGYYFIELKDVLYCKSDGAYTEFHLQNNEVIVSSKNLGDYEPLLEQNNFFRTHKSFMVNVSFVKSISKIDMPEAVLINKQKVPIAGRRLDDFLLAMQSY